MFTRKFFADAAERVVATASQAFLAVLTVASMAWGQKLQVVGVAALAAALKCLAATQIGANNTAAVLPKGPDTDQGHSELVTVLICAAVAIIVYLIMAKLFHV